MYQTDEIIVKRVRFMCKDCNKTFTREIEVIVNKEQISHNTKRLMLASFSENKTFKDIAKTYHVAT